MKLLLHTCCAPCSVAVVDALRAEGIEPTAYYFNPNIHPFTEWRMRRNTLVEYAKSIDLALVVDGEYGLRTFLDEVGADFDARCPKCYRMRLEQTARYAAEHGYTAFSTTLLVSPYQNHALLIAEGERAAAKYGVEWVYRDFRPVFREGQDKAKSLGLYMQKYCGCIFSEEDRYKKRKK